MTLLTLLNMEWHVRDGEANEEPGQRDAQSQRASTHNRTDQPNIVMSELSSLEREADVHDT